ncbi:uncharacterized protein [Spinacia oleracea]|uniref:Uncharacterized protein isoform X1 n=1 Tax=Spinacia oleracea TaxID=3562 RepID=A0A9R0JCW3_SPIOL|nr:uncharacterized protein LOC110802992 isoform X1 [Spinacia oleracea]XP_021864139.2 uncharacterized protein LOC110802992 isoform X1 [Spinacia oleracea]XP_056692514.1 uncharacterized protein LOC110802992 isoform X1 [Spinacia oleracea]
MVAWIKFTNSNFNLSPFTLSYRTWQANNKGSRKSLRWKEIICSRKPEMLECGYYVMKYMYQIVLLGLQSISNVEEYRYFLQTPTHRRRSMMFEKNGVDILLVVVCSHFLVFRDRN